jgi:hypothetical protein
MTALPKHRKRLTMWMVVANLTAIVAAAGLAVTGVVALSRYSAARNTESELPLQRIPATPTGLLGTVDEANVLTSLTVFVANPDPDDTDALSDQRGGSIISIPVNADTAGGLADAERISLQQVFATDGADGLTAAAEAAIGLSFDFSAVQQAEDLAGDLLSIAPFDVDFARDVVSTANGDDGVVFAAGPRTLTAAEMATVLVSHDVDQPERFRRPILETAWRAVASSAALRGATPALLPAIDSMESLIAHVFAGPVASRGLPAKAFDAAANPEGRDVELLDRIETVLVFGSIAPAAMAAPLPGPLYRLEAPPGYEDRVRDMIGAIIYFGGNVTSINLNGPAQEFTDIVVYDELDKASVEQAAEADEGIRFVEPTVRIEGVDIWMVLGARFLDATPAPTTSVDETSTADTSTADTSVGETTPDDTVRDDTAAVTTPGTEP